MKILVAVKRVIDPYVKVRVKSDNSGVETQHVKMSMNPFDEIAVEEAIRLKEQGKAQEVIVVSIGADACQETLRTALALGADRGIHVHTQQNDLVSLNIAKILKRVVEQQQTSLIIMGKQAIDGDNNQTGQMLAALLDWPQASFASKIDLNGDEVCVMREIDGGLETIGASLPLVITTDLRLNEPRYASLPNIMKAKRKPLERIELSEMNLELKTHRKILKVVLPETRKTGEILHSVEELVEKLSNEAKVL